MQELFVYLFTLFVSVFLISVLEPFSKNNEFEKIRQLNTSIKERAFLAQTMLPNSAESSALQNGITTFVSDSSTLTQKSVQAKIARLKTSRDNDYYSYYWNDSDGEKATVTSMGIDYKYHFVQSYLLGIRPFETENDWLPLYAVSQLKTYQRDNEQYGIMEIWQNSVQAFTNTRGDCEDHAIVLADWLISEGLDARVAVGYYKGNGHAWVVVYKNDKVYLLEATSKRIKKSWNHYPLAMLAAEYEAEYMFNRDSFWLAKSSRTRVYDESNWKLMSTFSFANDSH